MNIGEICERLIIEFDSIQYIFEGRPRDALNRVNMQRMFMNVARDIYRDTAHGAGKSSVLLALREILASIRREAPEERNHPTVLSIRYAYAQLGGR